MVIVKVLIGSLRLVHGTVNFTSLVIRMLLKILRKCKYFVDVGITY